MPSTQTPQDLAVAASLAADAITALANSKQTSALHLQAYYAHSAAAAAWTASGTNPVKAAAVAAQANTHLTNANSLIAAGK